MVAHAETFILMLEKQAASADIWRKRTHVLWHLLQLCIRLSRLQTSLIPGGLTLQHSHPSSRLHLKNRHLHEAERSCRFVGTQSKFTVFFKLHENNLTRCDAGLCLTKRTGASTLWGTCVLITYFSILKQHPTSWYLTCYILRLTFSRGQSPAQ